MTDRSPAADLLDRARSLAARYDGPPVPAWLMAASHRGEPITDPLFAAGGPHDPQWFHPRSWPALRDWERAYPDPPAVWLGLNLGGKFELPRWEYDDEDSPEPVALFPPPSGEHGVAPGKDLWSLIGFHAFCPATGAVAERWAKNGIGPPPSLTAADYEVEHRRAADLCRGVRRLARSAGPDLAAVSGGNFPLPFAVAGPRERYGDDPVTLFLLATFGIVERADHASRPVAYRTDRSPDDDAPLCRTDPADESASADAGDAFRPPTVHTRWTPWHWTRISDLGAATVQTLEWLTDSVKLSADLPVRRAEVTGTPLAAETDILAEEDPRTRAGDGWMFDGKVARFRGVAVPVTPTQRVILELLTADPDGEIAVGDLATAVERVLNGEDAAGGQKRPGTKRKVVTKKSVKEHVSRLNRRLDEAFDIRTKAPDRPVIGRGEEPYLTYRIDEARLPAAPGA